MSEPTRYKLTDEEREALESTMRWHFAAHAENPKSGYASAGVMTALNRVASIVTARMADAWDERGKARPQYLGPIDGHYDDCMGYEDCCCASYPNPYRAEEKP